MNYTLVETTIRVVLDFVCQLHESQRTENSSYDRSDMKISRWVNTLSDSHRNKQGKKMRKAELTKTWADEESS